MCNKSILILGKDPHVFVSDTSFVHQTSLGGLRILEFGSVREKPRKYYLMLLRQILLLLIFILLIHMLKGD